MQKLFQGTAFHRNYYYQVKTVCLINLPTKLYPNNCQFYEKYKKRIPYILLTAAPKHLGTYNFFTNSFILRLNSFKLIFIPTYNVF